jgi:hypothetical protein
MHYLLDENKKPYQVSLIEALELYKHPEMKVTKQDNFDGVRVSTVFLGMDHGWGDRNSPDYQPILWETMVFGGEYDDYQERYTSHEEALEGHQKMVELVKQSLQTKS